MAESERKRKAEEDLSAIKVYKKQKTRRTLSPAMDTQEPGTQSVSNIHLSPAMDTQEPPAQREGESLTEAGSGVNTDGAPKENTDTAGKSGESTNSDDDDFDGDDFNHDGAAIQIDLHKVGGVPGSSKHQPHPAAETLRRHQWVND